MRIIAVALYRLSHFLGTYLSPLGVAVKQVNQLITGADIAYQATFGPGLYIPHPGGVVVGPGAVVGDRCTLGPCVTIGQYLGRSPRLGNDVEVGAGARVIGDVTLGNSVKVAPNAVVTHDFGDDVVLVGIPARVLGEAH